MTLVLLLEVAKRFGSDATAISIKTQWCRNTRRVIEQLDDHVEAGGDAKDLNIGSDPELKSNRSGQILVTLYLCLPLTFSLFKDMLVSALKSFIHFVDDC